MFLNGLVFFICLCFFTDLGILKATGKPVEWWLKNGKIK